MADTLIFLTIIVLALFVMDFGLGNHEARRAVLLARNAL